MENTRDLSQFGFTELRLAGRLLTKYANNNPDWLGEGVFIEFNPMSGKVFLVDKDNRVGMLDGTKLKQWLWCSECGKEGFADEFNNGMCCGEAIL